MRELDERTLVSGQISPSDMDELKRQGVRMIINNRPDHEDPDQPTGLEIETAARAAGIDYRHVPVRRGPGPADVEAMQEAMAQCSEGKMLAYCRSGTRSTMTWALARAEQGVPKEELVSRAAAAGYDLGPVSHLL
jgi:uncharacterized protein (TIGR01244 family)